MVKSLFRLKAVLLIVMLSMLTLSTYAGNTYYSKTTATASPTGAGKVYVAGKSADIDTIPDAKFKDSAEYLFSISYDSENDHYSQQNDVWLYAKAASDYTFEGWALANNPTEIISTDAKFSPAFKIYSTDEEEPDVFEYIAIFSGGPSDAATLTYAVADQGGVGVKVKKGEVTLDITAEECWAVATLTVNEEDKLADLAEGKLTFDMQDDATVAVTSKWADEENLYTESDIVNGIITTTAGVKVYVKEGSIYVEPDGATVSLYTVTGAKIASKTPTLKTAIFTVPAGTYIVKVGTEGIKVSVPVAE